MMRLHPGSPCVASCTLKLRDRDRDRGHDPATAAAGAAVDRMLAGLRHLAGASRAYAATLEDPDVDGRAKPRAHLSLYETRGDSG